MHNPVSAIKTSHRQKAFALLAKRRRISRVEIARELGVSLQTAMKIMQYFTDFGLAECMGEGHAGQVGRKPQMYAFNPDAAHMVAAVHEGSILSVGVLNLACDLLAEETVEIREGIHELLVEQPCEIAEGLLRDRGGKQKVSRLLGMGLCLPGVIDDKRNEISFAPSFAVNTSYHIGGLLEEVAARIGAPVCVENDVNAAAYGELSGIGVRDAAFISFGSHVGMGLVLDGKLRRGPTFRAGEIGLIPYGEETASRRMHRVEELIGLDALKKRFGFHWQFGMSKMAEEARLSMIDMVSDVAAHVIAACVPILDLSDFILGGITVELLGEEFFQAVRDKVNRWSPFEVRVRKQSLLSPALIGGAKKVMDRQLGALLALDSSETEKTERKSREKGEMI